MRTFNRVLLCLSLAGGSLFGGTIALTGHDDDFHQSAGAVAQAKAMFSLARNGSGLKVLTFDSGSELTSLMTLLGIAFTNVNPNTAASVTDALFDPTVYSAFAVASDTSCGGCDNTAAGEANIAAHVTAIGAFLNAGGGIVGFAGADSANYYAFVPQVASSVSGAPLTGYSSVCCGIPAVNGDFTHNLFWNPGTHGESAFFQVAEVNSTGNGTVPAPAASTIVCIACTVSGGIIISSAPEPASYALLAGGLGLLALVRKLRAADPPR